MTDEEKYLKSIREESAQAHAELWCRTHEVPVSIIQKDDKGYFIRIDFPFN